MNEISDGAIGAAPQRQMTIAVLEQGAAAGHALLSEGRAVRNSVLVQREVFGYMPRPAASRCVRILASRLAGLPLAVGASVPPGPAEVFQCA